uniref:Uncharacterized protein n=1 Tax=Ananas comosus var. bracteatus TaxID=296719 RepID=A0A6V7Q958_ANACO|nr:unnamed protein product [Ananas comosus var. bracteatus]
MLKTINNHLLADFESFRYDHVVCIAASKGCKLENLQLDIAEKIGLYLKQDSSITTSHTSAIFNFLKNKKFLLLLDDLWEPIDLAGVGIPQPNGARNQKIVLTTRFEEVCGNMGVHTKIKLECLEPDNAWELFKNSVSEDTVNSDARIQSLARKVCRRCSGLPLALISVGRSMSTKRTLQEWENAIASLENTRLSGNSCMKGVHPVLSTLRFSYDSLEDEQMKRCFLTCALWPEGYSIWKVELVDFWMALGLQPMRSTIEDAYNEGFSRIERLKKACLLEDGDASDKEVRVHDVIRDMALCVASLSVEKKLEWIVQPGVGLEKVQNSDAGIWTRASRISLMCNCIKELPQSPNCPNLLLLTLQQNFHLKAISPGFFRTMRALTFLDLSWTCIRELPREIGSLVKLQYLSLRNSDIVSLPLELGFLTELRFLNLSYTDHLKTIPRGVISKLSMLQFLNLFKSKYSGFEMEIHKSTETKYDLRQTSNEKSEFSLEELHYLGKGLKSLGISVRTVGSLQMLSECSDVYLYLLGIYRLKGECSLCLNLHSSTIVLNVKSCFELEELSIRSEQVGRSAGKSPPRLEFLTFWRLYRLKKVHLTVQLTKLRQVIIVENRNLVNISWILKIPYLEQLDLSFCCNLVEVIGHAEDANDLMHAFSRLRIVQLHHLPRLERFCAQKLAFPSLEYLDVYGCPLLQELPFQLEASRVSRLRQIRAEKGWSDQLELGDNDTARRTFQSLFKVFENSLETFEPDLDTNPFMSSASSFFARRQPMMRTALQFSAYLSLIFGDQMPLE